ncbi:MAG: hypothetical protein H7301_03355 [Cryobacterium sp.]|nr:hypothetical protein [Oligoflexia bacterium]
MTKNLRVYVSKSLSNRPNPSEFISSPKHFHHGNVSLTPLRLWHSMPLSEKNFAYPVHLKVGKGPPPHRHAILGVDIRRTVFFRIQETSTAQAQALG